MFAYNVTNQKVAAEGELLWLVTLEDEVLIQPPGTRVSNHVALAKQMKGGDWTKQKIMAGEPLGFGGTIANGQITYSGLMGSEGNVPKAYDPHGSIVGANRVQAAVSKVYEQAEQMGISVDPAYSLNAVVPGQGVVPHDRFLGKTAASGSFYNEVTGKEVDFVNDGILESNSGAQAWSVYDKVTGDYYEINEDGVVHNAQTHEQVGSFDAFLDPTAREPDDDRDMDWYPEWDGPTASTKESVRPTDLTEAILPGRSRGILNDDISSGRQGDEDAYAALFARMSDPELASYSDRRGGGQMGGIEWDAYSRELRIRGFDQGGQSHESPRGKDWDTGNPFQWEGKSKHSVGPRPYGVNAPPCPNCGNPTAEMGMLKTLMQGPGPLYECPVDGTVVKLDGTEKGRDDSRGPRVDDGPPGGMPFGSPSSPRRMTNQKTAGTFEYAAAPLGIHGRTGEVMGMLGLTAVVSLPANADYPEGLVATIPGQSMDVAWWGLDYEDWEAEGIVIPVETDADPAIVTAVFDELGGRPTPGFDQLPEEVQKAIRSMVSGPTRVGGSEATVCPKCGSHTIRAFDQGENNIKCLTCGNQFHHEVFRNPESKAGKWTVEGMGGNMNMDSKDLMRRAVIQGLGLKRISLEENDAINEAIDTAVREREQVLHGLMPHQAFQPELWRDVLTHAMEIMGMPHSLEADDEAVQEMWPDTLPWDEAEQDYYRNAKTAADGKYNAGQRVEIEHQSHKGQRGTIVEYSGKHEDFDEEQYKVLLDSGEELENVNESFFKKIKSAKNMINHNLPDSTSEYNLDTMHIAAPGYPMMPGQTPGMEDEALLQGSDPYNNYPAPNESPDWGEPEMEIANCPACEGPGMLNGVLGTRVHYRCRNCGLDFSHKEEPSVPQEVLPPEPVQPTERFLDAGLPMGTDAPAPQGPAAPGMPMAHVSKWNDSNGQPLSAGAWYRMHHNGYKVPDVVRILNLEDNRIEAAIDTDIKGAFPIIIQDNHEYSFEPITKEAEYISDSWLDDDPEWDGEPRELGATAEVEFPPCEGCGALKGYSSYGFAAGFLQCNNCHGLESAQSVADRYNADKAENWPDTLPWGEAEQEYYRSASHGWRISRKKFSPAEQRALIEENTDGRARNMEKLDLSGTHYELKDADLDPDFLWGM